jgi:hypothetical protein
MVFLLQEYDRYQSTLNDMSQVDIDRFSENLTPISPGVVLNSAAVSCTVGSCHPETMTLSNNGPVPIQISRIYINSTNSTQVHPVCSALCIFDPSNVSAPFTFDSKMALIDAGDTNHALTFWVPSNGKIIVPDTTTGMTSTVIIVTTRGRVFTFQWPFSNGIAIPQELRKDIGPFRLVYDSNMITLTDAANALPGSVGCANNYPSVQSCYSSGFYFYPTVVGGTIFYVRLGNIGGAPIILLDSSYILAEGCLRSNCNQQASTSVATPTDTEEFYLISPMSLQCHDLFFLSSGVSDRESVSWRPTDSTGICPTPSAPATIHPYNSTASAQLCYLNDPCYSLPNATLGTTSIYSPYWTSPQATNYVLFGATGPKQSTLSALKPGYEYFLYLELSFTYYILTPNQSIGMYKGSYATIPYECYTGPPLNWCYSYQYAVSIPLMAIST